MKRFAVITAALALLAAPAFAETVHVKVKGMVCAFCAAGVEASFQENPNVTSVKVALDKQLVTLTTADDQILSDHDITNVIKDAGYDVVSIHHQK